MMREGKSRCWKQYGDVISLMGALLIPSLKTCWGARGHTAHLIHSKSWGHHHEVVLGLFILGENRGLYITLAVSCSHAHWGGVGWPSRRESCFFRICPWWETKAAAGECWVTAFPSWLCGFPAKIMHWGQAAWGQPRSRCEGRGSCCHRHRASPGCRAFTGEASVGWGHGRLLVKLAEIS